MSDTLFVLLNKFLTNTSLIFDFQLIAPKLFPQDNVHEFQNCFDRAPAVPLEEIQNFLHEELGGPIDSYYEFVDPTSIASASIAQVYNFFCLQFFTILCLMVQVWKHGLLNRNCKS